jgi:hypothetical protein
LLLAVLRLYVETLWPVVMAPVGRRRSKAA